MITKTDTVRYLPIREACAATGLSQYFLRNGCKEGKIPFVRSGTKYYIDVYALMSKMSAPQNT